MKALIKLSVENVLLAVFLPADENDVTSQFALWTQALCWWTYSCSQLYFELEHEEKKQQLCVDKGLMNINMFETKCSKCKGENIFNSLLELTGDLSVEE